MASAHRTRGRRLTARETIFGLVALAALTALVVVLAPRATHVVGSGVEAVQTRQVGAFHAVDLTGANVVTIAVGHPRSVHVRGDANLLDHVTTRVERGVLVIGTTGSFTAKGSMHVTVSVPALDALTLSGSGVLVADGLRAQRLAVRLPGAGILRVSGSIARLDATLDGSGDAQLADLVARDVRASLGGTGRMTVTARASL